jgi:hypothetical protein
MVNDQDAYTRLGLSFKIFEDRFRGFLFLMDEI